MTLEAKDRVISDHQRQIERLTLALRAIADMRNTGKPAETLALCKAVAKASLA